MWLGLQGQPVANSVASTGQGHGSMCPEAHFLFAYTRVSSFVILLASLRFVSRVLYSSWRPITSRSQHSASSSLKDMSCCSTANTSFQTKAPVPLPSAASAGCQQRVHELGAGWTAFHGSYLCQHLVFCSQCCQLTAGLAGLGQRVSQGDLTMLRLRPAAGQQEALHQTLGGKCASCSVLVCITRTNVHFKMSMQWCNSLANCTAAAR